MHEASFWEDRIRLWEEATTGELVGYGWFQPPADLDWHVRRDLRDGPLPEAMLDWLADRAAAHATASGAARPRAIAAWALDADGLAVAALTTAGCTPLEAGYHHHVRSLRDGDPPLPEPAVPDGYRIRAVRREVDLADRVLLHRTVWHPSQVTERSYGEVATHYPYRGDTDIVIEAPDGAFVAYALGWFDPLGLVGELEPVGTHPDHRRLGLAYAASLAAIRRFRDLGAETAVVYSTAVPTLGIEGLPARDLYIALGMPVVSLHRRFERPFA
jgi:GNAT superfamily N-acetyltransferase